MNTPTAQQLAEGQKASDQVAAYLHLKQRGLIYLQFGTLGLLWLAYDIFAPMLAKNNWWLYLMINCFYLLVFCQLIYARFYFKKRHAWNVQFLAKLEAEFGDQLPWVQERNHFAKLRKIMKEETLSHP